MKRIWTLFVVAVCRVCIADRLSRVAFGSCNTPHRPSMWSLIHQFHPNTLLLLGDTIYADREPGNIPTKRLTSPIVIKDYYSEVLEDASFQKLTNSLDWMATIDDHDYGENNGDKTFKYKAESQKYFWDFTGTPSMSIQRQQNAVYSARTFSVESKYSSTNHFIYKVILLDTRSNKDVTGTSDGDFLGAEQWAWFENEINEPGIDLLLIGSSIQVLPTGKLIEEGWMEFPNARHRLLQAVTARMQSTNVVFLSGDVHCAEVLHAKCRTNNNPNTFTDVFELTSSGLSHTFTYFVVPGHNHHLDIQKRGRHFEYLYNFYQAIMPARYREQHFADHYQGPHFAYLDIIEEELTNDSSDQHINAMSFEINNGESRGWYTRRLEVRYVDHLGQTVIEKTIPLRANFQNIISSQDSNNNSSSSQMASVTCEPYWGEVSTTRAIVTRGVLALMLMLLVVFPLVTVLWFVGASGYYILYGAEQERRRKILERNNNVRNHSVPQ